MIFFRLFLFLVPLAFLFSDEANDSTPPLKDEGVKFEINNAILSRIHGKSISLIDLVKKMNQTMFQYYPEQMQSNSFRYQFYNARWKSALEETVDHELILADAEAKEIKVSDADVREEMEKRFGPEIILTLDKLKITLEEAKKSIKEELITQKMIGYFVYSRAFNAVTPEKIREAYNELVIKQKGEESWRYQVISFRGKEAEQFAKLLKKDLKDQKPSDLSSLLQEQAKTFQDTSYQISSELEVSRNEAAKELLTILERLNEKLYSDPCEQMSRIDQKKIFRIYYLAGHKVNAISSFNEKADEIRKALLNVEIDKAFTKYTNDLRSKFLVESNEEISENFHPFSMQ